MNSGRWRGKILALFAAGIAAVACAVLCARFVRSLPPYRVRQIRLAERGAVRTGIMYYPRRWFGGRYPGILFCHGMLPKGKDTELYVQLMGRLAGRGYLVACFDMPGFGKSAGERVTVKPADLDLIADVDAALSYMLRELPVEKDNVTIAGHSCGANPAFAVGARDRRVKNVVVLSAGNFSPAAGSDPEAAKTFVNRWWRETRQALTVADAMRVGKTLHLFQYLPLTAPKNVLIIVAELEWPWVIEYNRRLYDALTVRKKFLVVPASKHNLGFGHLTGTTLLDPMPVKLTVAAIDEWLKTAG